MSMISYLRNEKELEINRFRTRGFNPLTRVIIKTSKQDVRDYLIKYSGVQI